MARAAASRCPLCPLCASGKPLICNQCMNEVAFAEQKERLRAKQHECEVLKARLLAALDGQAAVRPQEEKRAQGVLRVKVASLRATFLQEQLDKGRKRIAEAKARNARRKEQIERVRSQLKQLQARRADVPFELSKAVLAHEMVAESLAAQQRISVQLLHRFFPLRVNGVRPVTGQPLQVTIANLKLVEDPVLLPEAALQDADGVAAALGYLLLYLEMMVRVMGGPILHEGLYLGCTSKVWQASTFWDPGPARGLHLDLHTSSSPTSLHFIPGAPVFTAWPGSSAQEHINLRHQEANMQHGLRLLHRSAACLCQHYAARHRVALPFHWSPFAWLALVADILLGDGCFSDLSALPVGSADGVRRSRPGGPAPPPPPMHPAFQVLDDEDDTEWNLVQRPQLPPTPSDGLDVEHWARAMITDAQQPPTPSTRNARLIMDTFPWLPFGRQLSR